MIALSKIAPLAQAKQPRLSATPVRNKTPAPPGLWITTASASWHVLPAAGGCASGEIGAGASGTIYFSSDVENAIYRITRK